MDADFARARRLQAAGELDEAEEIYRRILPWRRDWTLGNLGALLRITGRLEEAEAALREALAVDPANARTQHTLGMTLLQRGRYAEGWALYEARHQLFQRVTRPFQEWQGEPLRGKRILVVGEQGSGDQILWARFLLPLAEQASQVLVAVHRGLAPLLAQLPVTMVAGAELEAVEADVWTSIGSVPRWLEAGPADAPPVYLGGGEAGEPAGLGLMLAGGERNPNKGRIPPPPIQRALRGLAAFVDLDPTASGAADFAETARTVADLGVVSVDTSVAHLAGAMGRPCWTLLSRPAHDWYANWDDDRTPWYPSMRIVRQRAPGDWAGVVAGVHAAVSATAPR